MSHECWSCQYVGVRIYDEPCNTRRGWNHWKQRISIDNSTNDVSTQSHYTDQGIQPIVLMCMNLNREQFIGYLKGNIIKYVLRADRKNGVEDYAKAAVYASWLKEYTEFGKITVPGIGEVKP